MCHSVKTLISSYGANAAVYELDERPDGEELEKALVAASGQQTESLPVVFISQELVGGESEIMSLHVKGKLVALLKKAKAIWI